MMDGVRSSVYLCLIGGAASSSLAAALLLQYIIYLSPPHPTSGSTRGVTSAVRCHSLGICRYIHLHYNTSSIPIFPSLSLSFPPLPLSLRPPPISQRLPTRCPIQVPVQSTPPHALRFAAFKKVHRPFKNCLASSRARLSFIEIRHLVIFSGVGVEEQPHE